MVQGIRDPGSAVIMLAYVSAERVSNLQGENCEVGHRVHYANNPLVCSTKSWLYVAYRPTVGDTEIGWPGQIGTVRPLLIPSLDSSRDGVEDNSEVKDPGMLPPMRDLFVKILSFVFVQLRDLIDRIGTLSNQCTLAKQREDIREILLMGKFFHILHQQLPRDTNERILNPGAD
jgi:hypothetical protein